jgi:hypothetical protein
MANNALAILPQTKPLSIVTRTKAMGGFVGVNVATHIAGVGADLYQYYMTVKK